MILVASASAARARFRSSTLWASALRVGSRSLTAWLGSTSAARATSDSTFSASCCKRSVRRPAKLLVVLRGERGKSVVDRCDAGRDCGAVRDARGLDLGEQSAQLGNGRGLDAA